MRSKLVLWGAAAALALSSSAAMASVACTISGARMLGRMWRRAMRSGGLPTARAAST